MKLMPMLTAAAWLALQAGVAIPAPNSQNKKTARTWPTVVALKDMPEVTVIREDARAGVFVYQSPHYEFRSPAKLGASVVREFSRIFETTFLAIQALPLDYDPAPEPGREKFLCSLFASKDDYHKAGGLAGSAAVYSASARQILIPFESLGVKPFGRKYILDQEAENTVLIHEITHQMMNAWLSRLPIWFVEGSAEYVRMARYERGKMSFLNRQKNLQDYLQACGSDGRTWKMMPLQQLMTMDAPTWSASLRDPGKSVHRAYGSAALLVYYFYHLDDCGDARHTSDFLKSLVPRDPNLKAAAQHLLRERSYAELQQDLQEAFQREGLVITWSPP